VVVVVRGAVPAMVPVMVNMAVVIHMVVRAAQHQTLGVSGRGHSKTEKGKQG
jgi:hypothetical protein